MGSFKSGTKKLKMAMPRMQSSASQCCLCSIGVFMFLGGIIMIATGASLILNYGIVEEDLLLPELRSDDGKKIVGIILICVGLVFAIVSISVSAYYLCIHPNKTPSNVRPDDIKSISNSSSHSSSRNQLTSTQRPSSNQSARSNGQGARRKVSPVEMPSRTGEKATGNQFSQSMPTAPQRSKHKHKSKKKKQRLLTKTQLEDIKELDTISRKTMDIDYSEDTPRSQSEIDNNSLNYSEASGKNIPGLVASDHSFIHNETVIYASSENLYQCDSEDKSSKKQTRHHLFGSNDNMAYDGHELASTGSESTINKNVNDLNDEQSQTSSL